MDDLYVTEVDSYFDRLKHNVKTIKVFKNIADTIIEFVSQIEDFQKKLWEKKKFVLSTEWVITIDRLVEYIGEEAAKPVMEEIIKNDMSMSVSLLRMINSAYYGYKVSSIRQASTLLGIKGLKKWSVVYLVEGLQNDKPDILFVNTLTRAKFAESLAESFNFKDYKGELFTMGMLSMIDAFMDQPLVRVLKEVPFSFLQSRALLFEKGKFGDVLKLVKAFEDVEWDKIKRIQKKYKLEAEKTYNKYLESVDFAYETMNVLLSEV